MEDQQPDPGDLTTAKTPVGKAARQPKTTAPEQDSTGPDPAQPDAAEADTSESEAAEADASESEVAESEPPTEPDDVVLVEHRPAGRRALIAAALAAVAFVGAAGYAGAAVQPYLMHRALVETKYTVARTATDAITTLWTYTPEDMNTLADRASVFLGGDFAEEYRRYIDAIVEPNKQAQVSNTTQVMGAAVESLAPEGVPNEATAIVYTNSVATSPVTKNIPSLRYLSYRLTMQRDGGEWLITRMSTITTFDLTPQL
ncbi:mammalian cell entry protein [Mycobacterium sp. pV006]|uniref:mammalian cell entry protein n=1 Tax=Mycobacterium sp. pV006 TaxID=3238983 RepID=UPI00351B2D34